MDFRNFSEDNRFPAKVHSYKKLELVRMRKVWKNIAYIDKESPLMSYQRKPEFHFSNFNLGLSIDQKMYSRLIASLSWVNSRIITT